MKFTDEQIKKALDLLEEAKFGLLAEEFLIRVGTARQYYAEINDLLKKSAELFKHFPKKTEQLKKELQETKLEIVSEMLKNSLLFRENDSPSLSLSGNPFLIHKQN